MGQGAIHLSGSDRSPSGWIGYTQPVCERVCVCVCDRVRERRYCIAPVANEIDSLRTGELETKGGGR